MSRREPWQGVWRSVAARRFRSAFAAAPVAVTIAVAFDLTLAATSVTFATKILTSSVVLSALASIVTLVVALGTRHPRAFFASVLTLAAACALADLPIHRSGAALFASITGAAVLVFAEAGGAALEPNGGGKRIGRPAAGHAVWVTCVAAGGAIAGWMLLALQSHLSGLGLAALGVGVVAAIGLIALAAVLTVAALADRRHD